MSRSAIACRDCGHTLAHRHHTGRIDFAVGIRAVMTPDGRTKAVCPCGNRQTMYVPVRDKKAA